MAEASNLAQRQMTQRKEVKSGEESLELSIKIAVATAKEDLFLDVEAEGSDILSHTQSQSPYSKNSSDVRPVIGQATCLCLLVVASMVLMQSLLARRPVWLMMSVLKVRLRWTMSVFPKINQTPNQR